MICAACGARVVPMDELNEDEAAFLGDPGSGAAPLSAEAQLALQMERQRELFDPHQGGQPRANGRLQRFAYDRHRAAVHLGADVDT